MLFSEKVVRVSESQEGEIPKRHWANIISSAHMADCLWISRHELRGRESRTDPAIIPSQYVCTLIAVPGEYGAAARLTHHTELVGMWVLWHGGSVQQSQSKIYCSIWQQVLFICAEFPITFLVAYSLMSEWLRMNKHLRKVKVRSQKQQT